MMRVADRVERVQTVADMYEHVSGFDRLDFLTDLIVDALHWSTAHGIDFDRGMKSGKLHFMEERHEEGLL